MGNSGSNNGVNNNKNNKTNNNSLVGTNGKQAYGACQDQTGLFGELQFDEEAGDEDGKRNVVESEFSPLVNHSTTLSKQDGKLINCDSDEDEDDSYYSLLKNNQAFRLYFLSLLVTNCGEWLTYIASIDLIEKNLASIGEESRTAISILVLVRLLPNLFCCSLGGILADKYDRRKLMYGLDIASAWSSVLFVFAYE